LLLTFAIGRTTVLKAAKYSASPIGGARPPDHARFTLNPTPSPAPHCSTRNTISVVHCSATLQQLNKVNYSHINATFVIQRRIIQ
jgi:hypothetical protein